MGMVWVKSHTRNGKTVNGFWRHTKGEPVTEVDGNTKLTFYEKDGEKRMNASIFSNDEWHEVADEKISDKDYNRGVRVIEDKEKLMAACINGEDTEKIGKEFEAKYGEEETIKVVNRAKEEIRRCVIDDIENGESMPYYQDDLRTQFKMDYLKDKYGDSHEQAKKRAAESYTIVMGDKRVKITGTKKCIDGGGNVYYTGMAEDGTQRMINPKAYQNRIPDIEGMSVVGEAYQVNGKILNKAQLEEVVKESPYADVSQYEKHHGFITLSQTEDGSYWSVPAMGKPHKVE